MKQRELISREEEIHQLEQLDYSELSNHHMKVSAYGYVRAFEVLLDYSKKRWLWSFVAGMIAGIFIAIAYITAAYSSYHIANTSIQKLVLGVVFSTVIIPIYFIGGTFLTAYMSLLYPATKGIIRPRALFRTFSGVYVGNITGMLVVVIIASLANVYQDIDFATFIFDNMGLHKMYEFGSVIQNNLDKGQNLTNGISAGMVFKSILFVFASGILCNFLVSLSASAFKATKEQYFAAMVLLFLVIAFFAVPGFQHCVANWFSLWSILFISAFQKTVNTGTNVNTVPSAIAGWFFLINILPAILGNLAGGFFMGYLMAYFNQPFSSLAFKKARLTYLKEEQAHPHKHKHKRLEK